MRATDPAVTFFIIVVIGLVAGIIFDRIARPSWLTRQLAGATHGLVTSALIGASRVSQIDDNVGALANLKFSAEELAAIDQILASDPR